MAAINPSSTVQADATSGLQTEQKSTSSAAWQIPTSHYPVGATPITAASGNVAAGVAAATLAAVAAKTTFITGFEITGGGATGASLVVATLTGTITGTLSYIVGAVAGATLANTPLLVQFASPIPASAANTAIVVSVPSLGVGNTNSAVVAHGYQL